MARNGICVCSDSAGVNVTLQSVFVMRRSSRSAKPGQLFSKATKSGFSIAACRFNGRVVGLILLMNFERLAKRHFGRDFAVAVGHAVAVFAEKFREPGLGHAVMRCLERLPNFFAASKGSGIRTPGLTTEKIGLSGFVPGFVGLRGFIRLTVEITVNIRRTIFFNVQVCVRKWACSSAARAAPNAFGVGHPRYAMLHCVINAGL
jgi:hypothetical protein